MLVRCGVTLLQYEQYEPAREFLELAVASGAARSTSLSPSVSNFRLDLATALFHTQGANAALAELDKTPEEDRKGDYYLLRAQLLDSLGKMPEAAEALNRGMQASPTRASLYFQGASFLLKYGLRKEALALLEQASRMVPDEPELLLAQWVTLGLLSRVDDARKLLAKIQARWPEWDRPYLLNGILLEMQLKSAEAQAGSGDRNRFGRQHTGSVLLPGAGHHSRESRGWGERGECHRTRHGADRQRSVRVSAGRQNFAGSQRLRDGNPAFARGYPTPTPVDPGALRTAHVRTRPWETNRNRLRSWKRSNASGLRMPRRIRVRSRWRTFSLRFARPRKGESKRNV